MSIPDYLASGERARLIPVAADSSKEVRAASILLACLERVRPFARELLGSLGQRVGARAQIACYTEVVFRGQADQARERPDGLIVLDSGGGRQWRCLVEAKIGKADLEVQQVERYLAIARAQKIDAVLTLSNQFVALPSHSPLSLPKSALRGVDLFHWSWMYLLTQAELQLNQQGFEPADQRYILAEMQRYFSHPSVGVSTFDRMNAEWKEVNAQVQAGARLNRNSPAVENTVAAWHQEARDLCLLVSRKVARSVDLRLPKAHRADQALRLKEDAGVLAEHLEMSCQLEVPDAASPIGVVADLQRRSLEISMSLVAPADKQRSASRISWVLRQLAKSDPVGIHVRAHWPSRAPATQATLASLREDPSRLEAANRSLVPSRFEVLLVKDVAGKFAGAKTFIEHLEDAVPYFYEQVGQHLRAYVPPPPRLRREADASDEADEVVAEERQSAAPAGNGHAEATPEASSGIADVKERVEGHQPTAPAEASGPPEGAGADKEGAVSGEGQGDRPTGEKFIRTV